MENILSFCCKNNTKESPREFYKSTLPEEGIISIITLQLVLQH